MLTEAQFVACVRAALNNLYEPDRLRRNPLAALFGVAERPNTFSALQSILIKAIESLQPAIDGPHQRFNWDIYELLFYRYVQQLSQNQVARQLGMSVRHLRRKEGDAVKVLADHLWRHYCASGAVRPDSDKRDRPAAAAGDYPDVSDELAWLKTTTLEEPSDINQALGEVVQLMAPLTAQHGVQLEVLAADLPRLAVHPVALSQLLLNLLGVAIHRASGGSVTVSARPSPVEVDVLILGRAPAGALRPASANDAASLDLARQLADLCGARMSLSEDENTFRVQVTIPAREQVPVLVIDDNVDTLELLRRYAVDSRYSLITVQDAEEALSLAQRHSPRIIVLDVMMPHTDGWKVLGRLRQHPATEHIPVIVCTILAQEELAFSLGASGFVRKPLSRQAFLSALDQQVRLMATESR
jgi:CheY-like chemotaxis protein/transcriptional regulator with XRE-family HTH domain